MPAGGVLHLAYPIFYCEIEQWRQKNLKLFQLLTAVDLLTDKSTQHAAQDIASVVVKAVPSSTEFVSDIHILKQFFSRQQHHGD